MYDRNVWEATPGNTLLHQLDVRTKLIVLISFAVVTLTIDSPRSLFLLFAITLIFHAISRSSLARWRILAVFVLLGIWGSMASQALFYNQEPRTVMACLLSPGFPVLGKITGGVFVYREGLQYGAVQALRSGIMLSLGLLLSWTSDPRQLLKSFLSWRMPYELAFMVITSLRFLPVIFQETAIVLTAQRLRGFQPFKTASPRHFIQMAFQTLFPILARTLRRAATLASSVESRGFGRETQRSYDNPWSTLERSFCYIAALLVAGVVSLKILDVLQFNGLVYIPAWRSLYDMMKVWM